MTDLTLAPGCYGFALAFKEGSPECAPCPFAARCQITGAEQLARRRAELGIVVKDTPKSAPAVPRARVAAAGLALSQALPKKVEELLARIERAGLRVGEALREGRNPFAAEKPVFLRVACHLLLNLPQGIDRATLRKALERKLDWSEGTAAAHATQAFQALTALGAATEANGRLILRK